MLHHQSRRHSTDPVQAIQQETQEWLKAIPKLYKDGSSWSTGDKVVYDEY